MSHEHAGNFLAVHLVRTSGARIRRLTAVRGYYPSVLRLLEQFIRIGYQISHCPLARLGEKTLWRRLYPVITSPRIHLAHDTC
jgi:hypothetical protein